MKIGNGTRMVLLGLTGWFMGCISAPDVVLVEEKTALEKQAAGELRSAERSLQDTVLTGRPDPYTRSQMEGRGSDLQESSLGEIVQLYTAAKGDGEKLDGYLLIRCVGEAENGLVVVTSDACQEDVDPNEIAGIVERTNRARRQIWGDGMKRLRPESSEAELRKAWRKRHLQAVICGAWIEMDGQWQERRCDD